MPGMADWDLPALANVNILASGGHPVDPMPFFRSHGHKVKTLFVSDFPPSIEDVIAACASSLEALFHPIDTSNLFKHAIKYLPNLQLVGFLPRLSWTYFHVDHFEELFDAYFDPDRKKFPEMKELRFERCEREFRMEEWNKKRIRVWKKQRARWHLRGVTLVMPGGRLFPVAD